MKALISGIKRMEIHDGDGLRTTVFFKGCPLKCIWCHNPESISYVRQLAVWNEKCILCEECKNACNLDAIQVSSNGIEIDLSKCNQCGKCVDACPTEAIVQYGKEYTIDELIQILLLDEPFYRNSKGGVTFSGGECLTQHEFVTELAKALYERHISVNIDTSGFVDKCILDKVIPYVDTFLYDIKAIDPSLHKKFTGVDNVAILDNLKYLSEKGCRIEIRYPLIKGYNDGECEKIGKFVKTLKGVTKIKVLQYHHFAGSRYEALRMINTLPNEETTIEDVKHCVNTLCELGIYATK